MGPFCLPKSTKNGLKTDPKRHQDVDRFLHRFFIVFGSILGAKLGPSWPLFRVKTSSAVGCYPLLCCFGFFFRFFLLPDLIWTPVWLDFGGLGLHFGSILGGMRLHFGSIFVSSCCFSGQLLCSKMGTWFLDNFGSSLGSKLEPSWLHFPIFLFHPLFATFLDRVIVEPQASSIEPRVGLGGVAKRKEFW